MWEENHLNELQKDPPPQVNPMSINDLEQYATYRAEQLWEDKLEQTINIDEMEKWDTLEQNYQNEQLIQKNEWEDDEFLSQQLQQPSNNEL